MARLHSTTDAMAEGRLRRMLQLAVGVRAGGQLRTSEVAAELGVAPSTVRRWIRDGVPTARVDQVEALVRPTHRRLREEAADRTNFAHAVDALDKLGADAPTPSWVHIGWESSYKLSLVKLTDLGVLVPRITAYPPSEPAERRHRHGAKRGQRYGQIVRSEWIFPSRYHAALARLELLDAVSAWRVQLRPGLLERGTTQAWLLEAPTPRRAWMKPYQRRVDRHLHTPEPSTRKPASA